MLQTRRRHALCPMIKGISRWSRTSECLSAFAWSAFRGRGRATGSIALGRQKKKPGFAGYSKCVHFLLASLGSSRCNDVQRARKLGVHRVCAPSYCMVVLPPHCSFFLPVSSARSPSRFYLTSGDSTGLEWHV